MARMIASCRAHSRFSASTSALMWRGSSPPAMWRQGGRRGSRPAKVRQWEASKLVGLWQARGSMT